MDQIPESRKKALEEAVVKGYGGPCVDCGRRTANFCESCVWVEGHSGALRENYKFAFFCNLPQYVKEPYKRFLENKLREHYDFTGSTIDVFIRKK